ncbi:Fatty acid synthase alpha subunit [Venustampulla echinocandica]|uniref:beta-ketoacyl-[acyl-carrier-protein] synthase I n=1 Tax=Venustampulla echinocandica TaxID=2656787 RepID=A0A370TA12_9HELO|nr:Fatty acid synthase alpha subunit [Venustampulla echinocandica]RDL30472.1 Fatty acid synthase alpha subunit [Venustampulla echinocandica]
MHPQIEQQLAHLLLTELLAHQFASPVRWIETQDVLLNKQRIERIIEIGPADTLVSMAKKTLASRYQQMDNARHIKRKLLYYGKDAQEICYEGDQKPEQATKKPTPKKADTKVEAKKDTPAPPPPPPAVPTQAPPQSAPAAASHVDDIPVSARDIVMTIIAMKLKKSFEEIPLTKNIKQLVGGRSTLENELVGDIGTEFGSTPERPEELPLDELCLNIQNSSGFSGKMGKTTTGLLSKLFSLKMPGGCSPPVLRSYLNDRWGLPSGRQDSIFLRVCAAPPAARLGSMTDVHGHFDNIVQQYSKETGLNLGASQSNDSGNGGNSGAAVMVDNKALEKVTRDRDLFMRKKLELYAHTLGVDLRASDKATNEAQKNISTLQGQLDLFDAELGDVFASGIKPMWSAPKVRRFDSHWNWVVQETLELFYTVLNGDSEISTSELASRSIRIANRSNPRLLGVMQYLVNSSPETWGPRFEIAKEMLSQLIRLCEATKNPCYMPLFSFKDTCIKSPRTQIDRHGKVQYDEVPRSTVGDIAPVHIKTRQFSGWAKDKKLTNILLDQAKDIRQKGLTLQSRKVLLTGASPGSIGSEILIGLLSSSCRVIVTTSSYSPDVVRYYQGLYENYGARGSELVVAPFNQGSQQDLEALVAYIFDPTNGLGWDLDYIVPFAAISEAGRQIDGVDSKSELAHRIMLTNTIRLLGAVKQNKESRGFHSHPAQVILPLSPNHGAFGNDGLYAESKIGLESLFDKWHSESWAAYLSICGAVIGWTRGTGLMADNNVVAAGIERLGVRTFSQSEMAYYILVLMSRPIALQSQLQPLYADLTGGLDSVKNLKSTLDTIRRNISDTSHFRRAIASEETLDQVANTVAKELAPTPPPQVLPRANIPFDFPQLPDAKELDPLRQKLNGMVDLDRVVVVTGYSEVGPWGNSRTRWEMEAYGRFSLEGCVEMAWIMGMIKHHSGPLEGSQYNGWVDTKTLKPVHDSEVKAKYEAQILTSSGIRLIEPELDDGYDPKKKLLIQETQLNEDMPPFLAPAELAEQFAHEHGDKVHLSPAEDGFMVYLKKGATLFIPKAIGFDRTVAGQIPTGWNARTYGIPEDIIQQVDRTTLFTLVSTAEALLASGITDPYELYKHVHVSEVGNCIGSGIGGATALKRMFQNRFMDKPAANDVLQESFINTTSAWVNMLLLSSSGPIRTPVGACATSIESLETGYETIVSGKAKMCLVGGFDDMNEVLSYEFANMKATSSAEEEFKKGRTPQDMSRPATTTRSGFMESQGSGVQVLTTARLAVDMGLPIHGIVAYASTSSDKMGRSVPAPGQGITTNARQTASAKFPSPLLNIDYRRKRLTMRLKQIQEYRDTELEIIQEEFAVFGCSRPSDVTEEIKYRTQYIEEEATRQTSEALNTWGNEFWKNNPQISPLAGSLGVWGLTVDDIDFASFHGTSTVMNDKNESEVIQQQLSHMGRKEGHPIYGIFQKYLTGHPKGAAGAWMFNGCLQVLDSGIIPGNRAADNIDAKLEKNDLIFFPNRSIQMAGLKAFSVTSFGFGQKGAQAIGIHPKYLLAALDAKTYDEYKKKLEQRQKKAFTAFHTHMATNSLFAIKESAPYGKDQETAVYLDPKARVSQIETPTDGTVYLFKDGK